MNRQEQKRAIERNNIKALMEQGYTVSAIAKELELSYKYTKLIYWQLIDEGVSTCDTSMDRYQLGSMQGRERHDLL